MPDCAFSLRELPYTPDAVLKAFAPFSSTPWAMLLHSGFALHAHNRFDIMTAGPLATLTTRGSETLIGHADGTTTRSAGDPLQLLQEQLDTLLPALPAPGDLPFYGGAVGLWGYDLGRRFERLPARSESDIVTPDMAVGIYDWALIADHHAQKLFLLCHGDSNARLRWLENTPAFAADAFRLTGPWQANMTQAQYRERFERIQHYIRAGDCYQINLTQRFSAPYEGDEWQAFMHLSQANRAPFSAFLRFPDAAILSLSPERFLELRQGEVATRPIKGTLPRCADPDEDAAQAARLAASEKDRAENLMIVDLMRNDIGRVAAPGSVRVPELFTVEPFPAVHHLVSTVTARLKEDLHATDLLRACFPGGSITGAPKIRAMAIIEELEPQRRNAYCGSIGYISRCGNMDTSITIRTLIAEQNRLYCWAGGGIVADSHSDAEYQESFDKLAKILPILSEPKAQNV